MCSSDLEIPGFGDKTAEKVLATAQEFLAAHEASRASVAGENEFTPDMEAGDDAAFEEPASSDHADGGPHV